MGKRFKHGDLEKLKNLVAPEEYEILLEADDPVFWAERHLMDPDEGDTPFKAKEIFYDYLRSPCKDRAGRTGRQLGKTVHECVDILHAMAFNTNYVILCFIPNKKQMNRMLEIFRNLLRRSDIRSSYYMGKPKKLKEQEGEIAPKYDYEITCSSGSVCRFFFVAQDPDKARGQRAKGAIYLDECEYFPERAFPVIQGILKSDPSIKVSAFSTPSGLEGTWFREFCDRCKDQGYEDGIEYHLPTRLEANWPEIEKRLRDVIFDETTWLLEVEAEWVEARGAVYKKEIVDSALERGAFGTRYLTMEELRETMEYDQAPKALGVDWNIPQNGVRLIELALMFGKVYITRHERISHADYTQTLTVDRIMELHRRLNYRMISVDAGYGAAQIEILNKCIVQHGQDPRKVVNVVDSNKKIEVEITYPATEHGGRRREKISQKAKTHLVGLCGRYLETRLVLPKEEEGVRDGLISEIRNFRRKATVSDKGVNFIYSDQTHSLSALQIGIEGFDRHERKMEKQANRAYEPVAQSNTAISDIVSRRKQDPGALVVSGKLLNRFHSRTGGLGGSSRRRIL